MKYIKYYLSPVTILTAMICVLQGAHAPTLFFIGFSLFVILGDFYLTMIQLSMNTATRFF